MPTYKEMRDLDFFCATLDERRLRGASHVAFHLQINKHLHLLRVSFQSKQTVAQNERLLFSMLVHDKHEICPPSAGR